MQLGRGHTKGDTVAWLPQQKILFSGDLVEYGATPYAGDAYFSDWPATLDKVEALGRHGDRARAAAPRSPTRRCAARASPRPAPSSSDMYASVRKGVAQGHDLKRVFSDTDAALRPRYGHSSSTSTACPSTSPGPTTRRRRIAIRASGPRSATRTCGPRSSPESISIAKACSMNAPDAAARFGSGRAVPRIEDRALLEGRGRFTDNVAVEGAAVIAFLRSPLRPCAHRRRSTPMRRGRCRACSASSPARDLDAAGVKRDADDARLPARRRAQHGDAAAPRPGARVRALRRRGGRRGRRRDARAGARRARGDRPSTRGAAGGDRRRTPRGRPGRPSSSPEAPDNIAAEMRHGKADGRRGGVRPRRGPGRPRSASTSASRPRRWSRARSSPASTRRAAASRCASATRCPRPWPAASPRRCRTSPRRRCGCWSATSAAASA